MCVLQFSPSRILLDKIRIYSWHGAGLRWVVGAYFCVVVVVPLPFPCVMRLFRLRAASAFLFPSPLFYTSPLLAWFTCHHCFLSFTYCLIHIVLLCSFCLSLSRFAHQDYFLSFSLLGIGCRHFE